MVMREGNVSLGFFCFFVFLSWSWRWLCFAMHVYDFSVLQILFRRSLEDKEEDDERGPTFSKQIGLEELRFSFAEASSSSFKLIIIIIPLSLSLSLSLSHNINALHLLPQFFFSGFFLSFFWFRIVQQCFGFRPPTLPSFFSTAQRPFGLSRKREKRETCVAVNPKASARLILKQAMKQVNKQALRELCLSVSRRSSVWQIRFVFFPEMCLWSSARRRSSRRRVF